jgi:hypothetical protein
MRKTVHRVDLAILKDVKKDGGAAFAQETFLLDSKRESARSFHEANIEHIIGKASAFIRTGF